MMARPVAARLLSADYSVPWAYFGQMRRMHSNPGSGPRCGTARTTLRAGSNHRPNGNPGNKQKKKSADNGYQPANAHQRHSGDLLNPVKPLCCTSHLALNTVSTGPGQSENVHQLTTTIKPGLPLRETRCHPTIAECREEMVGYPHDPGQAGDSLLHRACVT